MNNSTIAVFYEQKRKIELHEIEIPELSKGEILVKIEYTTLCRSDLNTFSGKRIEKTPTILGHEIVGVIEKIKDNEHYDERGKKLEPGDRVTWAIYASEPECNLSKNGIPQKGDNLFKYGHEQITDSSTLHGGLAEYIIIRENTPIIKVDSNIPKPLVAIINCSVATVAASLRLAGEIKNKTVAVSGVGMLGAVACAMCKSNGAKKVIAMDVKEKRCESSREFGADICIEPEKINNLDEYDIVLEYSGVAEAMEKTLNNLSVGGTSVWVGATYPQRDLNVNAEKIIRNIHTIKGLHNYNNEDLVRAVEFIENNFDKFPFENMIYNNYSLESINEAFDYALKNNPYRVGIKIN